MTTHPTTATVTPQEALALRWHAEVFEADDYDVVDEITTPDFHGYNDSLPAELRTREGTRTLAAMMRAGFSNYTLPHIEGATDILAGDRVVTFWRFVGTHDGEFLGAPPTGRRAEISGIDAFRIRGRIAELRQELDMLGWLRGVGLVPDRPGGSGGRPTPAPERSSVAVSPARSRPRPDR